MKRLFLTFALLAAAPSANAQTVSDADLEKALSACKEHKSAFVSRITPQRWGAGWEHCEALEAEAVLRKEAKEKSVQFSKDIAEKIQKRGAQ